MQRRKKLLIALGILALTVGIYGYQELTRTHKSLSNVKPDHKTSAHEFIGEFIKNEKDANEKFLDKIIAVRGDVKEIMKDEQGSYTIILGEKSNPSSIRCNIEPGHHVEADQLRRGSVVIIKGACTGFNSDELLGSDVILNRCVIENDIK